MAAPVDASGAAASGKLTGAASRKKREVPALDEAEALDVLGDLLAAFNTEKPPEPVAEEGADGIRADEDAGGAPSSPQQPQRHQTPSPPPPPELSSTPPPPPATVPPPLPHFSQDFKFPKPVGKPPPRKSSKKKRRATMAAVDVKPARSLTKFATVLSPDVQHTRLTLPTAMLRRGELRRMSAPLLPRYV